MSVLDPQHADAGTPNPEAGARPEPLLPVVSSFHPVAAEGFSPNRGAPTPDAGALLKALRRRWLLAITLGLIVGGFAAGATWLFMPKAKHTARTLIQVRAQPPSLLFPNHEQNPDPSSYQRTQAALVKSRLVLNVALRDPSVNSASVLHGEETDAIETLDRLLMVDFNLGPEIMRISISGNDEDELVSIVNAVAAAYDKEIVQNERRDRERQLDVFKELSKDRLDNLKIKQSALAEMVKIGDPQDPLGQTLQRIFLSQEMRDAQTQLLKVVSELRNLKVALDLEEEKEKKLAELKVSADTVDRAMKNDSTLLRLGEQRDKLERQIQDITPRVNNAGKNLKVIELTEEINRIDDLIANKKKELRPVLETELATVQGASVRLNISLLRDRNALAENIKKTLEADIERLAAAQKDYAPGGRKTLDLESYRITVAAAEDTFKRANGAVEALQVELKAPSRFRILEKGVLSHGNDLKRRSIATAATGFGGFGLILFGIAFVEFRSRKIQSADEVTAGTGLRVVGTLPALPTRRRLMGAHADAYWQNLMTESVDALRTQLLHTARKENLRIVMVTSAVGGEGKTSLSSHLAASLARSGRNTLLVDCDLRKPATHRMFDLASEPGFSELLRGEVTIAEALQPTQAATLSVITAGSCDAAALQALAHGGAGPIFEQLRGQYDFVVIDTAPVLPVADSLLIGEHVDAVVFSLLRDISRMPRVYAAYQRLAMLGIHMLGAVVNGTREEAYGPDYHYAYAGK